MCNAELWMLAEQGKIKQWSVFRDKEDNEIIWTGKSFQANTEIEGRYTGMCFGDEWAYVGIEEPEDEFSKYMNPPEEVFQFESNEMTNKLKKHKPKDIDELTIV